MTRREPGTHRRVPGTAHEAGRPSTRRPRPIRRRGHRRGLLDRSSRPTAIPEPNSWSLQLRVVARRTRHRWGGRELGLAASTVQAVVGASVSAGSIVGPGHRRGPATPLSTRPAWRARPRRRQTDLRHPTSWWLADHGRGRAPAGVYADVGYRFIPTDLDDRTRLACSEIHRDEQAVTASGVLAASSRLVRRPRHHDRRVLSDNGSCTGHA